MRVPSIDDYVFLSRDLPELALPKGEIGIVRSQWFAPEIAYEVEFHPTGDREPTRALLMADQICLQEESVLVEESAHA